MAQSLSRILLHLIFSTKNRADLIPFKTSDELHRYLASACRAHDSEAFRVGGTSNHVHIACSLPRTLAVGSLVQEIKASSSAWMKKQDAQCWRFAWQAGYGAFSLGQSQLNDLLRYIDNQQEHHKKISFDDELRLIAARYGVELDERYAWR